MNFDSERNKGRTSPTPSGHHNEIGHHLVGADTDLSPRNSQFGLEFADQKDAAFCNLNQGGLDTVVLNVAGTHKLPVAVGGGPLFLNARLFCAETNSDLEVLHLAMTAFSVDVLS